MHTLNYNIKVYMGHGKVFFNANAFDRFAINATSGEVYVTGALDRETKSEYSITVLATDLGGRTQSVPLTVNITDVNDETPTYQRNDYSAVLVENTTAFIRPLQVQVRIYNPTFENVWNYYAQ